MKLPFKRKAPPFPAEPDHLVSVDKATDAIRGTESDSEDYKHCVGFEEGRGKAVDAVIDAAHEGTDQ